LYGSIDNIDAFIGALAEDHLAGSSVGPLVDAIIVNQFTRLRDGDRFFYASDPLLRSRYVERVIDLDSLTLAKVIQWNTGVRDIQNNVFFDESVMFYQVTERGLPANMTVYAGPEGVKLVNNWNGRVIERGSLADISQVMIVGADAKADLIRIDVGRAAGGLEGGVVVHGGAGRLDHLTLLGTPRADQISVDAGVATVNGNTIDYSGFELMLVLPGLGRDTTHVGHAPGARVTVFDPNSWFGLLRPQQSTSLVAAPAVENTSPSGADPTIESGVSSTTPTLSESSDAVDTRAKSNANADTDQEDSTPSADGDILTAGPGKRSPRR
jgi:hypothetical protein